VVKPKQSDETDESTASSQDLSVDDTVGMIPVAEFPEEHRVLKEDTTEDDDDDDIELADKSKVKSDTENVVEREDESEDEHKEKSEKQTREKHTREKTDTDKHEEKKEKRHNTDEKVKKAEKSGEKSKKKGSQGENTEPDKPAKKGSTKLTGIGKEAEKTSEPAEEVTVVKLAEYTLSELPPTIKQHCNMNKISNELMEQHTAVLFRVCKFLYPNQKFPNPLVDEISPRAEKEKKSNTIIINKGKAEFKDPPKPLKKLYKSQTLRGSGGYGKVFLTKDPFRKERVALKRVPHNTTVYQKSNFTEIGFLAMCDHPNVIKYYNTWHFKGCRY